eukprot:SAG11_NODE_3471_length_2429_cov_2.745494_3_plen_112_part_00
MTIPPTALNDHFTLLAFSRGTNFVATKAANVLRAPPSALADVINFVATAAARATFEPPSALARVIWPVIDWSHRSQCTYRVINTGERLGRNLRGASGRCGEDGRPGPRVCD